MLLSTQNFQQDSQLKTAVLHLPGEEIKLPIISGTEDEQAIDITSLRDETGYITLDPGYSNTGACESKITFIDGESGVLRYRGYPIEELAEHSTFVETAWLLIYGELPTAAQLARFRELLTEQELLHEGMRHHFEGFPPHGHPMAMLSAMINACGCYHPELLDTDLDQDRFLTAVAILVSKVCTIAAAAYKTSIGQPIEYPKPELDYCANFLHMMFSIPHSRTYEASPEAVAALNLILILHADHEQNCSTSYGADGGVGRGQPFRELCGRRRAGRCGYCCTAARMSRSSKCSKKSTARK